MNKHTQHTPAPWTMQVVRTSSGVVFKVGPFPWKEHQLNHACIYADYPNTIGYQVCEANARLIAAAPDLLQAAQAMVDADEFSQADAWLLLYSAIAKATGPRTP